jgi:hypothetical protein
VALRQRNAQTTGGEGRYGAPAERRRGPHLQIFSQARAGTQTGPPAGSLATNLPTGIDYNPLPRMSTAGTEAGRFGVG